MPEAAHTRFTVSSTAYLRSLNTADRTCFAVHYAAPPVRNDNGTTRFSLNFPMLLLTGYLEQPEEVGARVAAILNRKWDRFSEPDPRDAVVAAASAVLARHQSEQFMRTADQHFRACQCRRCDFDALEAALQQLAEQQP